MSLMAVANTLCNSSAQRRFHAEPMVAATERLLHEKAPRMPVVETPHTEVDAAAAEESALAAAAAQECAEENGLSAPKFNTAA
jgi:hypothetical protein